MREVVLFGVYSAGLFDELCPRGKEKECLRATLSL